MPRFRVSVTAQLDMPFALDAVRLRAASDAASAKLLSHDTVHVVLTRSGKDAQCAADRALIDISRALGPQTRFRRPPVWRARRAGVFGLGRTSAGRWQDGEDDDGLGGVREPRRPIPPADHAAAALDPPAA